jgi:hypothetical protein
MPVQDEPDGGHDQHDQEADKSRHVNPALHLGGPEERRAHHES